MQSLFIAATGTGVGKTHVTLMLLEALNALGIRTLPFKPIETGVDPIPEDGTRLLTKCQELGIAENLDLEMIVPCTYTLPAAPYVAKGTGKIPWDKIDAAYKKLQSQADMVLIEGAGGLMVPVEENLFMIDLIERFSARTLLVTPARLGCINDTLLSLESLKHRHLETLWCVNLQESERKSFQNITLPFYQKHFQNIFLLPNDLDRLAKGVAKSKKTL